ncbi:DUF2834 domain-containing protein [soil metagenome]
MTPRWTRLAVTYLVIAIVGLIGTWTLNVIAITQNSTFTGEWLSNPPATQSLQVDLLVLATASGVFIVIEGRRVGIRHAWLFLPLAAITAAAFAVPLFLALRERKLAGATAAAPLPRQ